MKYRTIIETDEFEGFEFYDDGNGKYMRGIDAGSANGEWIPLYFTECEQESSRYMEEIKEIMECDADTETKCKMISNILTAKPHYFEKQDSILDKIKAEIEEQVLESLSDGGDDWFAAEKINECLEIIDKYRESEGEDANN